MGFRGPIYATPPTVEVAGISLRDAAYLQEEDAEYRARKKISRHKPVLPLFDTRDVENIDDQWEGIDFGKWVEISSEFKFRFHIVGHIIGAACVELCCDDGEKRVSILFSGDVGRYGNPLTRNPAEPPETDYVVCESTYGKRVHAAEDPYAQFADAINQIHRDKSILLVPAFAIGRTQQVTYLIHQLMKDYRIPTTEVHIDSPMAVSVTELYVKYHDYHAIDLASLKGEHCVFEGPHVHMHRNRYQSKELNKIDGPAVILSASGMLTGGRILHHMMNRLPDKKNIIAIVGYMAEGTLGRLLVDGRQEITIHKEKIPIRAEIRNLNSLSAHADYHEILHWLEPIGRKPEKVFCVHGEQEQLEAMAGHLREAKGWDCYIPELYESVEL